jgi:hypothetical protein
MSSWQTWLLILVLCAGACVASWFVSASVTERRLIAAYADSPKDTVYAIDTLWREVVRLKTVFKRDTVYVSPEMPPESLYVAVGDTISERFALHIEYAQLRPLHESGAFQNVRLDIRDSVRTVTVTERVVDVRVEYPLWQTIAISSVALGLGVWIGSR